MPTASLTARSRFAPYAARPPVKGRTSPIRSWNEQLRCAALVEAVPPVTPAMDAVAASSTAAATAFRQFFTSASSVAERAGARPRSSTQRAADARWKRNSAAHMMGGSVTQMRLLYLRMTVDRIDGHSVCGSQECDTFVLT